MIGMLNESQNLTNLAPFTEEFISRQPEKNRSTETVCTQDVLA
jgi:hypothetical protein